MKQIGLALHNYQADQRLLPAGLFTMSRKLHPGRWCPTSDFSTHARLLGYLEQQRSTTPRTSSLGCYNRQRSCEEVNVDSSTETRIPVVPLPVGSASSSSPLGGSPNPTPQANVPTAPATTISLSNGVEPRVWTSRRPGVPSTACSVTCRTAAPSAFATSRTGRPTPSPLAKLKIGAAAMTTAHNPEPPTSSSSQRTRPGSRKTPRRW